MRRRVFLAIPPLLIAGASPASAQAAPLVRDRYFVTSDGVRLHYLDAGPPNGHTVVLVPGWTMPSWIWAPQIKAFSARYRVIAFDPRGQGGSDAPRSGYGPFRRGQDIAELVGSLGPVPVLLVGWSLGVLDSLAYIHEWGDRHVSGLVLVDNSIGEEPPPLRSDFPRARGPRPSHAVEMRRFVRSMFRRPQSEAYLDSLTDATLRTPQYAADALLSYPVPRSYWREAVYSTAKPVLYAVRPMWEGQAENLVQRHPAAEIALFPDAGHALFVDEAAHFNAVLQDFITRRIWR